MSHWFDPPMLGVLKRAACGGTEWLSPVVLLACPFGPNPLAACGLAAVLARAGPVGAVWTNASTAAGDADPEVLVEHRAPSAATGQAFGPLPRLLAVVAGYPLSLLPSCNEGDSDRRHAMDDACCQEGPRVADVPDEA
ncbi:MAG: hypothetical protein M3460_28965 [Actinomycetota bacterium]|nr:hypothetical protein [Actinomycetota bacterium]